MSAEAPVSPYHTARADIAAERETILGLWREGLGHAGRPEAKLAWYYEGNPVGTPTVLLLQAGAERRPVGVAAIGPRWMRRGSTMIRAGALADFVVAREHRSFFPALHLQKSLREHGLQAHDLIYGLPNTESEAVLRRAGYRRIGESVRHARAVRLEPYLARRLPHWLATMLGALADPLWRLVARALARAGRGLNAEWSDRPPHGVEALADRIAGTGVLVGARDERFLTWRFAECPLHAYRFLALRAGDKLGAYGVCQDRGDMLQVSDFLIDPAMPGAATRLWFELAEEAYARGHRSASVDVLAGTAACDAILAAGWRPRPEFRVLYAQSRAGGDVPDARSWHLTAADEDE